MNETLSMKIHLTRASAKRRLVTGWAYICEDENGEQVVDHKNAILPADVLDHAVIERALRSDQKAGVLHMKNAQGEKVQVGVLVESMFFDRDKWAALGGKPPNAPTAGWLVTHYITSDTVLDYIERGLLPDLSIGGIAEVKYADS